MIIHNDPQGSPEWHAARAGKITASMFGVACDRLKKSGDLTAAAKSYARKLALERIGGTVLDGEFETFAMKRGKELEPAARALLAQEIGRPITECGFISEGDYGCSPDGLIGDDSGCEIKCLINADRILDVVIDNDISDFMHQIQGCMWITGRTQWEFCCYLPQLAADGRDLYHKTVHSDLAFIDVMVKQLAEFNAVVESMVKQIRANVPQRRVGEFKEPF